MPSPSPPQPQRTAPHAQSVQQQQQQQLHLPPPYDLRIVAHSLGCASILTHLVCAAAAGRPHRVRALVLLSPAGYHNTVPAPFWPFIMVLPWWHRLLCLVLGRERACEYSCSGTLLLLLPPPLLLLLPLPVLF
jgi:pimeloyl-ACP methyl ester carboxylesterase